MGLQNVAFGLLGYLGIFVLSQWISSGNSFEKGAIQLICRQNGSRFVECFNENFTKIRDEINRQLKNFDAISCTYSTVQPSNNSCTLNSKQSLANTNGYFPPTRCSWNNGKRSFLIKLGLVIVSDQTMTNMLLETFDNQWDSFAKQNTTYETEVSLNSSNTNQSTILFLENYFHSLTAEVNLTGEQSSNNNCSGVLFFFIFPDIEYIFRFASRHMEMQLALLCGHQTFSSVDLYKSRNIVNALKRLSLTAKNYLESQCIVINSISFNNGTNQDNSSGNHVTVLVPIVIIGFILFSCILIMRFCQDGESTLMMRAKIMKYHPEKDKQLLALIYQQIHKEEQSELAKKNHDIYSGNSRRSLNQKSGSSTKVFMATSQPCCSKDVISGPLVSTLACGLAPLKRTA